MLDICVALDAPAATDLIEFLEVSEITSELSLVGMSMQLSTAQALSLILPFCQHLKSIVISHTVLSSEAARLVLPAAATLPLTTVKFDGTDLGRDSWPLLTATMLKPTAAAAAAAAAASSGSPGDGGVGSVAGVNGVGSVEARVREMLAAQLARLPPGAAAAAAAAAGGGARGMVRRGSGFGASSSSSASLQLVRFGGHSASGTGSDSDSAPGSVPSSPGASQRYKRADGTPAGFGGGSGSLGSFSGGDGAPLMELPPPGPGGGGRLGSGQQAGRGRVASASASATFGRPASSPTARHRPGSAGPGRGFGSGGGPPAEGGDEEREERIAQLVVLTGARPIAPHWWCSLTALDLGGNTLGDEGLLALVPHFRGLNMLKSLGLRWTGLTDWSAPQVGALISSTSASLQQLDLSNNQLGPNAARAIAGVLPACARLQSLCLAWNCLSGGVADLAWGLLASTRQGRTPSPTPSGGVNGVDSTPARHSGVHTCVALEHLDLTGTNLDGRDQMALAAMLAFGSHLPLATLDLSHNDLFATGSAVAAQCLLRQAHARQPQVGQHSDGGDGGGHGGKHNGDNSDSDSGGKSPRAPRAPRRAPHPRPIEVLTDGCRLVNSDSGGDGGGAGSRPPRGTQAFDLELGDTGCDRLVARLLVEHEADARSHHRVAWTSVRLNDTVFRSGGGREPVPFDVVYAGWLAESGLPEAGRLALTVEPLRAGECEWS
ncbi:hypothetical protein FOA52_010678 [Chlamydomonas sp. UWO 241]|nr:hypothetical protein FOA52_010678 [Chlamydomonas sp. UWO 241]